MVKKLKKQVVKQTATPSSESNQVTLQLSGRFSGPLPPPSLLQEYENILPGMAERLVATFEKEANHRHTVELTGLNAAINQVKRGQKYGLIIRMSCINSKHHFCSNGSRKNSNNDRRLYCCWPCSGVCCREIHTFKIGFIAPSVFST